MKNLFFIRICSIVLVMMLSLLGYSQVQTARYVSMTSNTNGYYEYLPQGYSSSGSQKYPLILFVHGLGELGNGSSSQLSRVLNNAIPRLINQGNFPSSFTVNGQTHRFIVISPQFVAWPSPSNIDAILDYVVENYNVDVTRIYMTGLSMGGGITWEYAGNQSTDAYAQRLAGIVPVCGASYPSIYRAEVIAENNVPVWAFHNQGDQTAPVYYTNDYVDGINSQVPAPVPLAKKTIFPVSGHDAWTQAYNPSYKENGMNVYEWMLQYSRGGATPPPANTPPTANAGSDKSITLPTNSVQLTGGGTDPNGSIVSYFWAKSAGPTQFHISNSNIANPTVTNLVAGTYTFRLTVTDNQGATDTDNIYVVVNNSTQPPPPPPPTSGTKMIRVNVYGGSNAYNNGEWNNWNTSSSLSSSFFKYSDGTTSNIKGVLSHQNAVADNSSTYTITMAPKEVGRYASYSTSTRTLSITGLDNSKTYSLEVYASRKGVSNNTTRFTINGASINVTTDNNLDQTAVFNSLSPSGGQLILNISRLNTYNYINGFTLTEVGSGDSSPSNSPPVANAGVDKTITLPVNSTVLSGSGSDAEGTVSFLWTKTAGPSQFTFNNTTLANPTVSNLTAGTYTFRLSVTDESGATTTDNVNVIVNNNTTPPPPTSGSRSVKVNVYGGSNSYSNSEWNNWNTHSSLNSGNLEYSDGTASSIQAVLSHQNSVSDNTTAYSITMAPKEVGRYTSYSTSNRTLTLSGLDNDKTYDLEIFASRRGVSNNTTRFTLGSTTINVVTDNNLDQSATFNSISPSGGQIVLNISRLNTFNYMNGFILTENETGFASKSVNSSSVTEESSAVAPGLEIFPNPVENRFALKVTEAQTGQMRVRIIDMNGTVQNEFLITKDNTGPSQTYFYAGALKPGEYIVQVQIGNWTETIKFTKLQ